MFSLLPFTASSLRVCQGRCDDFDTEKEHIAIVYQVSTNDNAGDDNDDINYDDDDNAAAEDDDINDDDDEVIPAILFHFPAAVSYAAIFLLLHLSGSRSGAGEGVGPDRTTICLLYTSPSPRDS